jgi:hypothetical protein
LTFVAIDTLALLDFTFAFAFPYMAQPTVDLLIG